MRIKYLFLVSCVALSACNPASEHRADVRDDSGDRVSVGKVQREIKVGMSSAEVVSVLGSPNIVTTDDERREQWVYDKIATETVHSRSSGGVMALILGGGHSIGGGAGGSYGKDTGAHSTSQRTLTIVVKFDKASKVRDFAYHNSSF